MHNSCISLQVNVAMGAVEEDGDAFRLPSRGNVKTDVKTRPKFKIKSKTNIEGAQYVNVDMYGRPRQSEDGHSAKDREGDLERINYEYDIAEPVVMPEPGNEPPSSTSETPMPSSKPPVGPPEEHIYGNTPFVKAGLVNVDEFEAYVNKKKAEVNPFTVEYDVSLSCDIL